MALTITQLFTPIQLPAAAAVLFTMPDATSQPSAVLKNGRVRLTNTSECRRAGDALRGAGCDRIEALRTAA
jgi:hypothetical protein